MIAPEFFLQLECDCYKREDALSKKHLLPQFCTLLNETPLASFSMGWDLNGLYLLIDVEEEQVGERSSVELFIDTKNLKTAKTTHRFCHHFSFSPELIDGVMAKEVTRFRTEDTHPLASSDDLEVKVKSKKKGYIMEISLPARSLVGYQPEEGGKSCIGFTYRINLQNGASQHFAVSSEHCNIEFVPYLWATLRLQG